MYRLYVDESGDHTVKSQLAAAMDKRYLCLFGCSFGLDYCHEKFAPALETFKRKHFGGDADDPVILHLEDMRAKTGRFGVLKNQEKSEDFYKELATFVKGTSFIAFAVVIDKLSTQAKNYGPVGSHPYHVGLLTLLERYCGYLRFFRRTGDVLAESRGGREDLLLKAAYRNVRSAGTRFHSQEFFQQTLTTKELKVKPKAQNIAGLQLADVFAHAAKHAVLHHYKLAPEPKGLTKRLADMIEPKYNVRYGTGQVGGYGKILIV